MRISGVTPASTVGAMQVAVGVAAGEHLGALGARVLDQLEDALARGVVDDRADHRALVARVADDELARARSASFAAELVRDARGRPRSARSTCRSGRSS